MSAVLVPVSKSLRDRGRGAAKGAVAGVGATATGGAVLGNAYHNATQERRVRAGKTVTRFGDIAEGTRAVLRPSIVRDLHGITLVPTAVGAGLGAALGRSRRKVTKSSQLRARGTNGKFARTNHGYQAVSVEVRRTAKAIRPDRKERSHSVGHRLR